MAHAYSSDDHSNKNDSPVASRGMDGLKSDLHDLAHDAAGVARAGATELRRGAMDAVDSAKGKMTHAKDCAMDATQSLKEVVSRNPVASIGIAAGVGIVLGILLCRPRS